MTYGLVPSLSVEGRVKAVADGAALWQQQSISVPDPVQTRRTTMDKNKMTLKELGLTVEQVAKHLRDRGMREEAIAMLMRTSTAMNMENWTLQRFNGHCA